MLGAGGRGVITRYTAFHVSAKKCNLCTAEKQFSADTKLTQLHEKVNEPEEQHSAYTTRREAEH